MRNEGFIEVTEQVSASLTGPRFLFSTHLIIRKCYVFRTYCGAVHIFSNTVPDILTILRTIMCI